MYLFLVLPLLYDLPPFLHACSLLPFQPWQGLLLPPIVLPMEEFHYLNHFLLQELHQVTLQAQGFPNLLPPLVAHHSFNLPQDVECWQPILQLSMITSLHQKCSAQVQLTPSFEILLHWVFRRPLQLREGQVALLALMLAQ